MGGKDFKFCLSLFPQYTFSNAFGYFLHGFSFFFIQSLWLEASRRQHKQSHSRDSSTSACLRSSVMQQACPTHLRHPARFTRITLDQHQQPQRPSRTTCTFSQQAMEEHPRIITLFRCTTWITKDRTLGASEDSPATIYHRHLTEHPTKA